MKSKLQLFIGFIGFCLLMSGCNSMQRVAPTAASYDAPVLNQVTEKELGDTLVDKGVVRTFDALAINNELNGQYAFYTWTASPGVYTAVWKTGLGTLYRAPRPVIVTCSINSCPVEEGGVMLPDDSSKPASLYCVIGRLVYSKPLVNFTYQKTKSSELLPGSFRQELIYNGRTDSALKFLYREFKDQYIRAPFTQEVTYDLKDGDVIGFKGARLQVIEATNIKIRYKALKNFE